MKIFKSILIVWVLVAVGCNPTDPNDKKEDNINYNLPGWDLVFHDEFDGESLNLNYWFHETGGHGWGNNEEQDYTDRSDNSYLEDGKLIIEAKLENYQGSEFTSARINSKIGWKYNRIDVKAKLPRGVGTWPAIWMLPDVWNYGNGSWPDNGEIDIMEHVGYDPGNIHASIHTHAYNHKNGTQKTGSKFVADAMGAFHVYSVRWYTDRLDFYIDEEMIFQYDKVDDDWQKWPFDKEFHLLLNLAIGGGWGGAKGIDKTIFPVKFEIDYVRVFEPAG
ncbi:MAG: glycoside hydrolase family 16 protein [Candidatus Marinimicrobia bacterium]|nr:glycoside hydrolase family 16 protein [Candidatus Neomarinimicrobiota bacterium]